MGSIERRLGRLEDLEEIVERRVEEALEIMLDVLAEQLPRDEFLRVLHILSDLSDKGGQRWGG
jgi:hypothetical protein